MKLILVLIAALSVASSQVSENPVTVLPQTATATEPITFGTCSSEDLVNFFFGLPNAQVCGLALGTIFDLSLANNTAALTEGLRQLCTRDCGGRYAEFLDEECDDTVNSETIRIYCTRSDGTSALGEYCRLSAGDITDPSLFNDLLVCDNYTVDNPCALGCRRALNRLREQVGCCYQHLYNNTEYTEALFSAGLLTNADYLGLVRLNNATSNPWMACDIRPPSRCRGQPFELPPTPTGPTPTPTGPTSTPTGPTPTPTGPTSLCTDQDVAAFFTSLPNPQECGLALTTVFNLSLANTPMAYNVALETLCTPDCGGRYVDFLETTCNDEVSSETIRIYCTPTDGSSTLGDYCRYSAGDIADPTLLYGLTACDNFTFDNPCSPGCRSALDRIMEEVGCCYQQLYNNTAYIDGLFRAGFITVDEYFGLVRLNDPFGSPWRVCNIRPPRRCRGEPFRPEPEPRCSEQDQIDFVSSLPNATTCGFGLLNLFTPPANDSTALPIAIDSVCNNECGGAYSNFLENQCRDELGAAALRVYCTATNGTANVGSHCRYAIGDQVDISLLTDLFACANNSASQPCVPDCRSALTRLKDELGCCYQNAYNDTVFNTILLNTDAIDLTEYVLRLSLGNPDGNPWTQCDITPPSSCSPPPFVPPEPLCTLEDQIEYASTLPDAEICGPSLATAFSSFNTTMEITSALENACTRECGGRYSNYLRSECGDDLTSELLRLHCTPTDGTAEVGDYCRFAAGDILDLSLLTDLTLCNITVDNPCSPACRRTLVRLRNQVGCCYQNIYNNTFYYTLLLSAGFVTHTQFLGFQEHNNPFYNLWDACNVTVPERCRGDPFPRDIGCPRGTYRANNRMCRPCPDNTDLSRSGGDATICPCQRGYYRAENEGPNDRCSAPPDACRNIQVRRRGSMNVTLSWSRPRNTGRDDFYYIVEYSDGRTTGLHSLVERMGRVEESIGGLRPNTEYTFTVTVHNGVSDRDERNEVLRQCEIRTRTEEGVPSPPADVEGFCGAVGWRFPRSPNGRIMRYDVQIRLPGREQGVMLETRFDGTFVAVPEDYQVYGATVRVRARTMAGPGAWTDLVDLGCKEIIVTTCPPCDCSTTAPPPPDGVYFTLGDVIYRNNSIVPVSSIGEGDNALLCRTDNKDCCASIENRFGEFYYPGGRQVPVNRAGEAFYRNRGESLIRLNRRSGGVAVTGTFRCEIRDASESTTSIYITLVT